MTPAEQRAAFIAALDPSAKPQSLPLPRFDPFRTSIRRYEYTAGPLYPIDPEEE